jgi:hypothetical protein
MASAASAPAFWAAFTSRSARSISGLWSNSDVVGASIVVVLASIIAAWWDRRNLRFKWRGERPAATAVPHNLHDRGNTSSIMRGALRSINPDH